MRRPALFFALLALALPALYECATLAPLTPGVCGNGVIDPGEDCDGLVDSAAHEACGAASAGAFACRFTCVGTAACPASFNCGLDQICRQPSGSFEPLGTPIPVGGEGVVLADFNGDGYADALTLGPQNDYGGSRVQVNYLNANGALLATYPIADRLTSPAVGDVNNDGIADLTGTLRIDNSSGIEVFLGQRAPSLVAQPFAAAIVPSAITALRVLPFSGFANGLRRAYFATGGSETYPPGLYLPNFGTLPDLSTPSLLTVVPLPEGPDMLVGNVQLTQVLSTPELCPAIVYAARQTGAQDVVRVVTGVCRTRADGVVVFATEPTVTTVTLPKNRTLCGTAACGPGALVADVDGNGNPDLIVSAVDPASSSGAYGTFVAYGDGEGSFTGAVNGTPDTFSPLEIALLAIDGSPVVGDSGVSLQIPGETLAVGDVNDDGYADFISLVPEFKTGAGPQGGSSVTLLLSHAIQGDAGVTSVDYSTPLNFFSWKTAAFADFNGDGKVDLVGGSDAPGIDFYGTVFDSSGNYVPEHFFVATAGGASLFAVGDVDGDGISDLAFAQKDPAGDGSLDLEVAYGASSGPLTAPLSLAHYPGLAQIITPAPYTELDVVANASSSSVLSVLRFITNTGGRPPLSSVALTTVDGGTSADGGGTTLETTVASIPGTFVLADGGTPGIAAVGRSGVATSGASNLWFLPTVGTSTSLAVGTATVSATVPGFSPNPELIDNGNQAVLLAAASLSAGGAGPASLVAVSSTPDGGPQTEIVIASLTSGAFAVGNLTQGAPTLLPQLPLIVDAGPDAPNPLPPTVSEDGQLALTDVDGDGYADLILSTGSTNDVCPNTTHSFVSRNVVVLWNDQKGGFGPAQVVAQCSLSQCTPVGDAAAPDLGCPGAFTTLAASPTGPPILAYATLRAVGFAQFGPAASGQPRPVLPQLVLRSGDAGDAALATSAFAGVPEGITGIASGDINGDGVPDLAIVARGTLYLFQGVPVHK